MKTLTLKLPENKCKVILGAGVLSAPLDPILNDAGQGVRAFKSSTGKPLLFVISDLRLRKATQKLVRSLRQQRYSVQVHEVHASEDFKSFKCLYSLYEWLLKHKADRNSVLFAVGGGVIGDTVGFLAGTYLRGIRWIGVPTTLLAQVDSSVGGKTGVNHELGKNLIGVFHQPIGVLCDFDFLGTLSQRDRISGLGEMIKYGLVFDPSLYSALEKNFETLLQGDSAAFLPFVQRCLKWKMKAVEKDEKDRFGFREVLNFGHTLGHALEKEGGYGYYRHGEAVILGMRMACHLSVLRGYLGKETYRGIEDFLSRIPVPPLPRIMKTQKVIDRVKWDKKANQGRVRFILLKKIGQTRVDDRISDAELKQVVESLRSSE